MSGKVNEKKLTPKEAFNEVVKLPAHRIMSLLRKLDKDAFSAEDNKSIISQFLFFAAGKNPKDVIEMGADLFEGISYFSQVVSEVQKTQAVSDVGRITEPLVKLAEAFTWNIAKESPNLLFEIIKHEDPRPALALMHNKRMNIPACSTEEIFSDYCRSLINHPDKRVFECLERKSFEREMPEFGIDSVENAFINEVVRKQEKLMKTACPVSILA